MRRLAAVVVIVVLAAALAAAALSAPGRSGPPQHPELNPLFAAEWFLRGHTTLGDWTGGTHPSDGVDAVSAWPLATGAGVVVAVADSGIDRRDVSFADSRILPGYDFIHNHTQVNEDGLGHGTHVATLVAGRGETTGGVYGVAPDAKILPVVVGVPQGKVYQAAAAKGIRYAATFPGVRVINMSWGVEPTKGLRSALQFASDRGVLLVDAAGNDFSDITGDKKLPRSFVSDCELTVAASGQWDELAFFSNWGEANVDVAAPGTQILSAFPGDTLKLAEGTSMASPLVAGVAALLFSRFPQASCQQVKQAIVSSETPVDWAAGRMSGPGIVNAPAALAALASQLTPGGSVPIPPTP